MKCAAKIVVFDLDETLGYYTEFGMFWDALNSYLKETKETKEPIETKEPKDSNNQTLFNNVLDLYPEFHRPNILQILNYLKQKKTAKHCHKLMIYTNNQGPPSWVQQIKTYFETKLKYELFDQVINAFKVNGKQVEVCRTSHMKSHKDLISCTKIAEDTDICFLDDKFHPGMSNDKIYYINIKPYIHDLSFDEMIERFEKSGIDTDTNTDTNTNTNNPFKPFMLNFLKKYNYTFTKKTKEAQNVDKILSKRAMHHLHIFFDKFNKNTNAKTNANTNTNANAKIKNNFRTRTKNRTKNKNMTMKIRNLW
jgi:hypothetical protein